MKINYIFILLLGIHLCPAAVHNEVIRGKVTYQGTPVDYVGVFIEGTQKGTTTDNNGHYELRADPGKHTLVIRALGYKTIRKEIVLNEHQSLTVNFQLQEDVLGLDQVVVSASRNRQNRKEAPVIVSVTNDKVLQATQSVSLSEGLNFQPGLRMETNCQNCGYSQVRINGLNGAYSQILINSKPTFSALNGVYGLDQIPANIIDRIEVVRGGGSALYGSNAIAGTINIITREPLENSFQIGSNLAFIEGKSPDRAVTINGTLLSDSNKAGITLYGLYRDRDPHDHDGDGFTEITTMQNKTFGFNSFYKTSERSKLSFDFYTIHEFRRGGNNLSLQPFESDITEQIESDVISGGLTYEAFSANLKDKFSVYATTQQSKNNNFYGGRGETHEESIRGFGHSKDVTWVFGSQYSRHMEAFLGGEGTFTGGLEYKYDMARDAKPGFNAFIDQTVRVYGLYAQQEWQISPKLKLLGGLRADFHNLTEEDVHLNPRANILYSISDNLQLRASYAKGFRAQQYFTEDLHSTLAAGEVSFVRFSPDLKPETSHSFLVSADWSRSTLTSDAGVTIEGFYTRLNDPFILEQATPEELEQLDIDTSDGQFIYIKKNSSGADVYGVNLEVKYAPDEKWVMQMGGTAQYSVYDDPVRWTEDESAMTSKARRFFKSPNLYGNFILTYAPAKKWQNNISGVYTGSMYVPHIAGYVENDRLEKTGNFFELNFKTGYTFDLDNDFQLQLNAGIQNLFNSYQDDFDRGPDRDANYIYGPSRPRTFFVGLKIGTGLLP
ncbi:TonB-dependent receptor [Sinomicrobium weinanense]|uniref:TonB-dependent receptor n=1 Tax=Sinomicrobium weinanense TaxID=2842200 RepID=A0A926JP69_9FLAO|nr:TonB-dependent receptor [Sinomicrobium weinanense]MBC9794915.1 TonB-dependent receptor [Sinomicrobium weinanense]MBU3125686.1 TonB-dependent receptor [Sinomicrobium weinanense]